MKILIAVPSKGRADKIQKQTLSWLQHSEYHWRVFVEPQDFKSYEKVVPFGHLTLLQADNKGLGYAKKYIYTYANALEFDLIFKVDDDLYGWLDEMRVAKKEHSAPVFDWIIHESLELFKKYEDLKGVGFPYRFEMWQLRKWLGMNSRLQSCYITRTESFYPDERLSVFEDFATYLKIRLNNGVTLRYGHAGMDCEDVGKNTGGHQNFNRRTRARQEAEVLRSIYPGIKFKRVEGKDWDLEPDFDDELFRGKKEAEYGEA